MPTRDSTSAAGAMRPVTEPIWLGFMLAGLGTSSVLAPPFEPGLVVPKQVERTTSRATLVVVGEPAGNAIAELRRLSGLTWEQLARLCKVSRRALHFWASGQAMTAGNEEHLQRLLSVIRRVDRGSATTNRTALVVPREDGSVPLDLLAEGHYEHALALLGQGERLRAMPPLVSTEALAMRAPRQPEELVDALHDRIHPASGRLLTSKGILVPQKK